MKAFLMYPDRDFDPQAALPPQAESLIQDLELTTLCNAMAGGDAFLFDIAQKALLTSVVDPEAITYRQRVLLDCLEQPAIVRSLYAIAIEGIQAEKIPFSFVFKDSPTSILTHSIAVLELFVDVLRKLRQVADEHAAAFRSEGFTSFFAMVGRDLDNEYFQSVKDHLTYLRFRGGVLLSAQLGEGNTGTDYVLRRPRETKEGWFRRLTTRSRPAHSFQIADRDEAGARALNELRDRGINLVANALAQSTDHILSFFEMLRCELGFYVGCLNLHDQLNGNGEPTSFPVPSPAGVSAFSCVGLYDACLALRSEGRVVGNDINAHGKTLVMITGANQGGKSTFLRSVGVAQLMMQCGMFVPAQSFSANTCNGLFTHYKREEDRTLRSGKLDEELSRMSDIADEIGAGGIVLFNESFAATNEREGSELARQIIRALLESGIKVFFVTHMFDLARSLYGQESARSLFLRAERQRDGERSFKLIEGEPLPTSFGEDLYERIFVEAPQSPAPAVQAL